MMHKPILAADTDWRLERPAEVSTMQPRDFRALKPIDSPWDTGVRQGGPGCAARRYRLDTDHGDY